MNHIIETQQFNREWLENEFFPEVIKMKQRPKENSLNSLAGKEMISFFYEPSTRTRLSFELAMKRLGGQVVFSTENAKEFSSVAKGEIIEDTVRVLCGYGPDVIVLRTDQAGMAQRAADFSTVPIINAGDGDHQHPTQALTDIYTIYSERGRVDDTVIAMCGDLSRGRTVRSLAYLISKFSGIKIYFISPEAARMRNDIKEHLKENKIPFEEVADLREIASGVDVIYDTRIQEERGALLMKYGKTAFWTVNREVMKMIKEDAIVMHPLPRLEEISPEVDDDARAAYFRQATNGLYVRMALLNMILG